MSVWACREPSAGSADTEWNGCLLVLARELVIGAALPLGLSDLGLKVNRPLPTRDEDQVVDHVDRQSEEGEGYSQWVCHEIERPLGFAVSPPKPLKIRPDTE